MQKTTIPSEKEALNKAASLCSQRECCPSEIREKLQRWGVEAETSERIVDRLVEERFIDEARYCRAYALDKMRYNRWGRVKINQMLRMMGLPEVHRRAALTELPDDEYIEIMRHLIQQKLPSIRARSEYERRAKLLRFIVGRGFESDLAIDEVERAS